MLHWLSIFATNATGAWRHAPLSNYPSASRSPDSLRYNFAAGDATRDSLAFLGVLVSTHLGQRSAIAIWPTLSPGCVIALHTTIRSQMSECFSLLTLRFFWGDLEKKLGQNFLVLLRLESIFPSLLRVVHLYEPLTSRMTDIVLINRSKKDKLCQCAIRTCFVLTWSIRYSLKAFGLRF